MTPVVLPSKEDRKDTHEPVVIVDVEIKHGLVLCDMAQAWAEFRRKGSLMRCPYQGVHLCFDGSDALCSTLKGIRQRISECYVGIDQMIEDQAKIAVARGGAHDLIGHRQLSLQKAFLRCGFGYL